MSRRKLVQRLLQCECNYFGRAESERTLWKLPVRNRASAGQTPFEHHAVTLLAPLATTLHRIVFPLDQGHAHRQNVGFFIV